MRRLHAWISALLLAAACCGAPALAAESEDACAGYIDALPATIATQGVWCLRQDLSTAIASGKAISISANNVTIDCNGYKLGGLAAGTSSGAFGIATVDAANTTIRNCTLRGFWVAIAIGGGGNLVEDNLLDGNLFRAIEVGTGHGLVQRNRVANTGGCSFCTQSTAILAYGDVIDNVVSGVFAVGGADTSTIGITLLGAGTIARGNRVVEVAATGNGEAVGIWAAGEAQYLTGQHGVVDNLVANTVAVAGAAVRGTGTGEAFCSGNHTSGYATASFGCELVSGNFNH